ncbi:MAG: twin-arginine translocation signal domain-containing protein, partial [Candidatus Acidiferrales bacterium]
MSIHGRREFLKFSLAGAGALAAGKLARGAAAPSAHRPLGVQLYTVRDAAERDLPGVLAAVRKIGYREVET